MQKRKPGLYLMLLGFILGGFGPMLYIQVHKVNDRTFMFVSDSIDRRLESRIDSMQTTFELLYLYNDAATTAEMFLRESDRNYCEKDTNWKSRYDYYIKYNAKAAKIWPMIEQYTDVFYPDTRYRNHEKPGLYSYITIGTSKFFRTKIEE